MQCQGFGIKWYIFFSDLEAQAGLKPENDIHIWLLHLLFMPSIDQDALEWAEAWNHHKMSFDGEERERSPHDMFFFGVLEQGLRGPQSGNEEHIDDLNSYGVDWADLNDLSLLQHHNQHNPDELLVLGPQSSHQPPHLSLIEVPTFQCPFDTDDQMEIFTDGLLSMPEYESRDMASRQSLWTNALALLVSLLPMSL